MVEAATNQSTRCRDDGRRPSYQLGIDVGGTFTDFLLLDDQGATSLGKTLSTDPPTEGVFAGLERLSANHELSLQGLFGRVTHIIHGTTITTNAVLTGRARIRLRDHRGLSRPAADAARDQDRQPVPIRPPAARAADRAPPRARGPGPHRLPWRAGGGLDEEAVRRVATAITTMGSRPSACHCCGHLQIPPTSNGRPSCCARRCRGYTSHCQRGDPPASGLRAVLDDALNAYVGPVLSRYLDELGGRFSGAGSQDAADHAVQRRRDEPRVQRTLRGQHAPLGSGGRPGGRPPTERCTGSRI